MINKSDFITYSSRLSFQPNSPFHEKFAIQYVQEYARSRPELCIHQDQHGNILLNYNGTRSKRHPRLILTAHLDHPGLIFHEQITTTRLQFGLYGGVTPCSPKKYRGSDIQYCIAKKSTSIERTYNSCRNRERKSDISYCRDGPSPRLLPILAGDLCNVGPARLAPQR